eukprot:TRINITY_DN280_c0_g3_i1.p1 TRINITY_DN280_c0_g3~~TRINITY_DN280_c0_g3_i1.p1  ORF type:complete len:220 (+),score=-0.60 TRINITY_DN280_c0_g3_i1:375-1034(+)
MDVLSVFQCSLILIYLVAVLLTNLLLQKRNFNTYTKYILFSSYILMGSRTFFFLSTLCNIENCPMITSPDNQTLVTNTEVKIYSFAVGEASIAVCYLSINFMWLIFCIGTEVENQPLISTASNPRIYYIFVILIFIAMIIFVPFSENVGHTVPYIVGVVIYFLLAMVGGILSYRAMGKIPKDWLNVKNFKKKAILTAGIGVILVIRSVIVISILVSLFD